MTVAAESQPTPSISSMTAHVEQIVNALSLSPDDVRRVTKHLVRQLKDGLANDRPWQLPTYVQNVPTGAEKGKFLAIDLGGSNCRVCMADLHGDSTFTVVQSKHRVPAHAMVNQSYRPLFDFIAQKLADFIDRYLDRESTVPYKLGFTFSFTCEQESLRSSRLIHWDKGWDIPEAIGRDPCVLLQEAIDGMGLPVVVTVLANDSVGTLLTRAYTSGRDVSTLGAVIFGTGTNAAYVESVRNLTRIQVGTKRAEQNEGQDEGGIMVINSEWGALDDEMAVLPRTELDDQLDAASVDPGSQMLEKRVSGLYLGELLRLAILQLLSSGGLNIEVDSTSCLFAQYGVDSSLVSQLAIAGNNVSDAIDHLQNTLSAKNISISDAKSIQLIAEAIARRAARLSGASLAAVVIQSGRLGTSLNRANVTTSTQRSPILPLSFRSFYNYAPLLLRHVVHLIRLICQRPSWLVPKQSPHLSGTVGATTLDEVIDFGADGSLIEFYPGFETEMRQAMREVDEIGRAGEQRIRITLTPDGSGVGAALMAYAASLESN
ncbi:Glucokinase [Penicillium oxalicum]|uniref:Glucokinase n=1 Tax=Penicillium oxalicum TaxID=69781 RepID=UPI0020B8D9D7|nr:Glucokinase [Penicillium oxalicum]KAI2794259.1 Glucokinase [Penicillium oxalicum]